MVFEHEGEYGSQWAAMSSIASKIGCNPETLRNWVRQAERDVYVAFVIDTFARRIVGWRVSRAAHADFVLDALEQSRTRRRKRVSQAKERSATQRRGEQDKATLGLGGLTISRRMPCLSSICSTTVAPV